jgi:WD40 repeat protein
MPACLSTHSRHSHKNPCFTDVEPGFWEDYICFVLDARELLALRSTCKMLKCIVDRAALQRVADIFLFKTPWRALRFMLFGSIPLGFAIFPRTDSYLVPFTDGAESCCDQSGAVAFNHDGTQVVSANYCDESRLCRLESYEETVCVWDVRTGELAQTLRVHSDWVTSVAFNHDGTQIVCGGAWAVGVWDARTGELAQTMRGHSDRVTSVAFNHDGTQIVSGSWDNTVCVWDARTGELAQTLRGHSDGVSSVAFNHDGTQIVSGSNDKTVCVWDARTGELAQTLRGHSDYVMSVAFNHDGTQIVSGSNDKTACVWDARTGELAQTLRGHSEDVWSVAFNRDGTQIVSGSDDSTVCVWNQSPKIKTHFTRSQTFETIDSDWINMGCLQFNPKGTGVVSGASDGSIWLWKIRPR